MSFSNILGSPIVFRRITSSTTALLALTVCWLLSEEVLSFPAKPNIIYILADDLGYGDLSCYGQGILSTPHIDRLAREGLRFTQHYAGATVCAPSRCVLMTGLHTGHCRIRNNGRYTLAAEDVTVAEVLQKAGYRTGCVGKWGVGRPPPEDPNRNGFDYFYGYVSMWHAHNCYPEFIVKNGARVPLRNVLHEEWAQRSREGEGVARRRVDYVPDLVTREALDFMERNRARPFFLYYALNVPHANNEGGKEGMEVPTYGEFAARDWPAAEKGFAAMIRNIDNDVGKLIAKLKDLGLDEKTLVIFTSDNGPHQEGGHRMDFFDSNGPLRGFKRDLYEGGIRVPMIARWPGTITANATSDHISAFQDMLPTFAELAGVAAPPSDGISMLPTLTAHGTGQLQHPYLYWEFPRRQVYRAVRQGRWKAVLYPAKGLAGGPIQLFDLSKDPGEQDDVAAKHPKRMAEMVRLLERSHTELER